MIREAHDPVGKTCIKTWAVCTVGIEMSIEHNSCGCVAGSVGRACDCPSRGHEFKLHTGCKAYLIKKNNNKYDGCMKHGKSSVPCKLKGDSNKKETQVKE